MFKFSYVFEAPAFGFFHEKSGVTVTDPYFDEGYADTVEPFEYYGMPESQATVLIQLNECLEEIFNSECSTAEALTKIELFAQGHGDVRPEWKADTVLLSFSDIWSTLSTEAAAQYAVLLALTHPTHPLNFICPEGTVPQKSGMLFKAVWSGLVAQVAKEFSAALIAKVGTQIVAEINRNNQAEWDEDVCHSHDFCDSNEVMLSIFNKNGWSYENDEAFFNKLWSDAWSLAKSSQFFAPTVETPIPGVTHVPNDSAIEARNTQLLQKAEELGIPGNMALAQYFTELEKRVWDLEAKVDAMLAHPNA